MKCWSTTNTLSYGVTSNLCDYSVLHIWFILVTVKFHDHEHCNSFSYVQSWIEKRDIQSEKANLIILFERYVPVLIDANRSGRFKKITPIQEVKSNRAS